MRILIYFTADLHFFHKNIIEYENRPFDGLEDMHKRLIANWNDRVKAKDEIYILGDFSFDSKEQTLDLLEELNGRKYLIKGNHDYPLKYKEVKNQFEFVKDYYVLKYYNQYFILFHYPIFSWERKHYGSLHLHGHSHSKPIEFEHKNLINVGVDCNNFRPICIDEIFDKDKSEVILKKMLI